RELAVEWGLVGGEILERARRRQLVDCVRARLHLFCLVPRTLDRRARIGHLVADSGRSLADPHLGLGGRVLRLDHFLLGAEGLAARFSSFEYLALMIVIVRSIRPAICPPSCDSRG